MQIDRFEVTSSETERFVAEGHYAVRFENFVLDLYFVPSQERRALIFSPGYLDRKTFPIPYFQRTSWLSQLGGIGISLTDPTLKLGEDFGVGWFTGTRQCHYLLEIAEFLARLLTKLGVPAERTLFFGSSAGGFASIGFAGHLPGSLAFAVNPQTNLLRFHALSEIANLTRHGFGGMSVMGLESHFKSRFHLATLLRQAGHVPHSLIWQNIHDGYHYDRHVVPFLSELTDLHPARIRLEIGADEALGHNPPGLPFLRPYFDEVLSWMPPAPVAADAFALKEASR
ncbi:hypothetical protein [Limimaricola sp. AA108-03]|uniref:hypothetical protein n=1 Tax=Limimaricola sp. AA108-03 TaxID=3425945 RepID=UPI003D777AD0